MTYEWEGWCWDRDALPCRDHCLPQAPWPDQWEGGRSTSPIKANHWRTWRRESLRCQIVLEITISGWKEYYWRLTEQRLSDTTTQQWTFGCRAWRPGDQKEGIICLLLWKKLSPWEPLWPSSVCPRARWCGVGCLQTESPSCAALGKVCQARIVESRVENDFATMKQWKKKILRPGTWGDIIVIPAFRESAVSLCSELRKEPGLSQSTRSTSLSWSLNTPTIRVFVQQPKRTFCLILGVKMDHFSFYYPTLPQFSPVLQSVSRVSSICFKSKISLKTWVFWKCQWNIFSSLSKVPREGKEDLRLHH